MMNTIQLFLLLVLAACNGKKQAATDEKMEDGRPNVILVITDDQGYGDIGAHGNPYIKTTNMDKLWAQSTRLTDFHVSPTCAPTRSSIMSGQVTNRAGAWHTIAGRSFLKADKITLPQVLADNGYATGMFGKWHLGDNYPYRPEDRGFQEVVSHLGGGVGQQHDYWDNDYFDDTYYHNSKPEKYNGYCTDIWFDEGLRFIEEQRQAGKPFFAYIATNAPHSPYFVENKYKEMYDGNEQAVNPAFLGMITNADDNLGKLMDYLDKNKIADNTILIFMTDNGTSSGFKPNKETGLAEIGYNAGMRMKKGSMYEGGHRVPFFIRWKNGGIKAGRDISELTSHIDMMPTLLDMLAIESPTEAKYDGVSIKPLILEGKQNLNDRIIITDSQRKEMPEKWRQSATMQGAWRLINGKSLYDIAKDPGQQTDLSAEFPEKFEELKIAYEAWWADLEPTFAEMPTIPLCTQYEPETLLRAHDVHLDEEAGFKMVPWNAVLMRKGFKARGFYAVEVPEDGTYTFSLMRWPPEAEAAITASLPPKPPVEGTAVNELPAGVALPVVTAGININEHELSKEVEDSDKTVSFTVELKKGKTQLRAWFAEADEAHFAAQYVMVTKG
ncbi:MAG: arylsulfatase [Cyclobacteriaceae bacterium]